MEADNRMGNCHSDRIGVRRNNSELVKRPTFFATSICQAKRVIFPERDTSVDWLLHGFSDIDNMRIFSRKEAR